MRYRYRKEEEMKDSGVEWIGYIPAKWNITKLKLKTEQINRGKSPEYIDESKIRVINQACVYWDYLKLENVKYQDASVIAGRGKLKKGDILINSTGTGTLGRANMFIEDGEFIADSHVTIVRCTDFNFAKYLKYALRTKLYQGLIYSTMVTGSTNQIELSREGLRDMKVLAVEENELIKMVNFLDEKTAHFDSIISKKEALIQRLEEAKKSLISEVVTGKVKVVKTADGYELIERKKEEMKDSGVQWLGYVPNDWVIKKVKHIAMLNPSKNEVRKYCSDRLKVSFVPMDSVRLGRINGEQVKDINDVIDGYTYFANKDIVMAKVTPCFENRNIAICNNLKNGIGFGSTELNTIRCFKEDHIEFFYYCLQEQNFITTATNEMTGAGGLKRVPSSFLLDARFVFPSKKEIDYLINYLNLKVLEMDEVIIKTKKQIEKIDEAKQSLISEIVTGKIEILE